MAQAKELTRTLHPNLKEQSPSEKDLKDQLIRPVNASGVDLFQDAIDYWASVTWPEKGIMTPLLSAANELTLFEILQTSTTPELFNSENLNPDQRKARDIIAGKNLRLVRKVSGKYTGRGLTYEDMLQEGIVGLMISIDKFNLQRGKRFTTYAVPWIRNRIQLAIYEKSGWKEAPMLKLNRVNRAIAELYNQLNREPTKQEIAESLGYTIESVKQIEALNFPVRSLETPIYEDEVLTTRDILSDKGASQVQLDEIIGHMELNIILNQSLSSLSGMEATLVRLMYGLSDSEPLSATKIGRQIGMSTHRVIETHDAILQKLRKETTLRKALTGYL